MAITPPVISAVAIAGSVTTTPNAADQIRWCIESFSVGEFHFR
jgi:hypothetical protein